MSDPRDRVPPPPRIVKSARKFTDPRLDNTTRPSTSVATKSVSFRPGGRIAAGPPATDPRLDNPTRVVATKTATNDVRPGNRLGAVVQPATADARMDAHTRNQGLNARQISTNLSRPAIHEPLQQNDVAARVPKKVTFNIEDFPLPVERRPVARNRAAQKSARFAPGLGSSAASERREELPSQSTSFFPERSSKLGAARNSKSSADVSRRGLGRQSNNNALDQRRATKSQQMRLHIHTESFSGKYARKFEGTRSRTHSRVPRMSSANRDVRQGHLSDSSSEHSSGSANYVDVGLKLSKLSRGKSSGNSVEIAREIGVQVKAARKLQFGRKTTKVPPEIQRSVTPTNSHSSESSDNDESTIPAPAGEDSEELEYVDLGIIPHNITREQTESSSESDVTERDETPTDIPSDTLIEALENISLTTIRLAKLRRLPFMLRNLRKGFLSRCKSLGIDPSPSIPPSKPVTVIYKCLAQIAEDRSLKRQETRTTMTDWKCPLCELHGVFPTQEILHAHLQRDHLGVGFLWDMDNYTLWVELPLTRHAALPVALPASRHVPLLPHERAMTTTSTRTASTEITDFSSNFHDGEYTPATTLSPSRNTSVASQPFLDADKLDIKPKWHYPILRTGSLALSATRSISVTSRTLSRASSSHASGRPTPPPQSDPLGPAAQYPYLLESDGIYSCRVGGPRLYDLLNTLPLDEFGVLAWVILDREEDIFEIDDVRDEDKVMQALWFRWIFLNRNKFVAEFFKGTETFINDNWKMIDRAAGVAALRTWLLVLSINNFLLTSDVVVLLRHYRKLTGKKHWYDDNHATPNEVAPV
ncbi:uncharacterized protein HD556DRAFT_1442179 [Suillus plorans]|uniref:Uncharacterized protein n=1 Tax=Suillus plorans TaxID=116603 RepID=A0A9P7DI23_9AGAM|nr:uncharacterized protein HD556DRAFT_1442179 [Suillus plorans]KAG1795333.1 hypothetical protein HD556DRAFT_1442179 [Suillus plorans]